MLSFILKVSRNVHFKWHMMVSFFTGRYYWWFTCKKSTDTTVCSFFGVFFLMYMYFIQNIYYFIGFDIENFIYIYIILCHIMFRILWTKNWRNSYLFLLTLPSAILIPFGRHMYILSQHISKIWVDLFAIIIVLD